VIAELVEHLITKFESSNTVANCEKVFYFKLDNFAARYRGEFATDLSQA
jgi:hypothetical protein